MNWWQADGAGIAFGVSALFLIAGLVMHRVIRRVLRSQPVTVESESTTKP